MIRILCIVSEEELTCYQEDGLSDHLMIERYHDGREAILHYESEFFDGIISVPQLGNYHCDDFLYSIRTCGDNIPFLILGEEPAEEEEGQSEYHADFYCDPKILKKYPEIILEKMMELIKKKCMEEVSPEMKALQSYAFLNCFNEAVVLLDKELNLISFNTYFLRTAIEYGIGRPIKGCSLQETLPFVSEKLLTTFRSIFSSKFPLVQNHEFTFQHGPVFVRIEGFPVSVGRRVQNLLIKLKNVTSEKEIQFEKRKLESELKTRIAKRTDELKKSRETLDLNKIELARSLAIKNVLFEIAEAAVSTLEQKELFKRIHKSLSVLINTESFYIGIHEHGTYFSFPYCVDEYDALVGGAEDMKGSLTNYVFEAGIGMLIDEKKHEELASEGVSLVGEPSKQWMGVPLIASSGKIGILVVQSYSDDSLYAKEDLRVLNYVSSQIASAIERTRQHEKLVRASAELEKRIKDRTGELAVVNENLLKEIGEKEKGETIQSVLFNIAEETLKANDIKEFSEFTHHQMERLFEVPNVIVILYNQKTKMYTFPYHVDEKDNIDLWPGDMKGSFTEYMRKTAEPLFFRYSDYEKLAETGVGIGVGSRAMCWMGCPLITNKGVIGAVVVQSYSDEFAYGEEDFRILRYVSQQIASSLEKKQSQLNIQELVDDLKKRNDELAFLNQELKSYTYSVSHDLRAPLRHIIGYTSLIDEEYQDVLDDDGKKYLKNISESCLRMNEMVDAFHKLSRINSYELNLEEINLTEVADKIAGSLQEQNSGREIEFKFQDDLVVWCDHQLITILLNNLLSNAVKFTKRVNQAAITLTMKEEKGEKIFTVKDNGVGFNPEKSDSLFIPFQRLHSAVEFDGTGVGLATVYRIIKRHDGAISATSEEGKGASFEFRLSATPPDTQ